MKWYLAALKRYGTGKGRSRRKEFWTFTLVNVAIYGVLFALGKMLEQDWLFTAMFIVGLLLLVPSIAVIVRRLHDTGRSGVWYLISFIPGIGPFILLAFCLQAGQRGDNKYGPDPRATNSLESAAEGRFGLASSKLDR
jgi:uncharacterized membrane protein YhaH (DUF805 family)